MNVSSEAEILLQNIGDALLLYGRDCRQVRYANNAARRLLDEGLLAELPGSLGGVKNEFVYAAGGRFFDVRRDITNEGDVAVRLRVKAGDDLERYRAMFRALMDHVPVGITIADAPDVRVRWVSRQGLAITGHAASEVRDLTYPAHGEGMFHADGVTAVRPEELPLTRAVRQGEVIYGEEWMWRRGDGREIWLLCDAAPIRDESGAITGGILAFSDITERKRSDAALRSSEATLRMAQQAARCGTWDWSPATGVTVWSDEYYNLYGIDRSIEPSYEHWLATIYPADREKAVAEIQRSLSEKTDLRIEFRCVKGGQVRWLETIGRTTAGPDGRPVRMSGIALDITERKQIEEQLSQANVRLLRSNDDLQKFAYVVSHDLQEPLRMIRTYAQLLTRRQQQDQESAEFLEFIGGGVERMQSLIRDLLEYSRVSYGERRSANRTDCNYTVRLAMEHLSSAIAESGATITIDRLPAVMANDARMLQLFQNLIGNAIKYRGADAPKIHVSARAQGGEWVFAVADNGIGISPEYKDRIFGVFQRLHPRHEYEGTGIGLAIVKRIVEQHGGRVWVESELGRGATFLFTIPSEAVEAAG